MSIANTIYPLPHEPSLRVASCDEVSRRVYAKITTEGFKPSSDIKNHPPLIKTDIPGLRLPNEMHALGVDHVHQRLTFGLGGQASRAVTHGTNDNQSLTIAR
jgi:hypothetical protein